MLKIGYHSNSNLDCKGERGFIDQLYIELGLSGQTLDISVLYQVGVGGLASSVAYFGHRVVDLNSQKNKRIF